MKLRFLLIFLALTTLTSCPKKPGLYGTINGLEMGDWRRTIYLIDPGRWSGLAASYQGTVLDSFRIDETGYFAIKSHDLPKIEAAKVLLLAIQKRSESYPNYLDNESPKTANYFPLVYQNGAEIEIKATADYFQGSFSIERPSDNNAAMLALRELRVEAFQDMLSKKENAGLLRREKAEQEFQARLFKFARQTPHLLPALTAIRWASIEGYYERVPEQLFAQAQKWKEKAPDHHWVKELVELANPADLPLMIGEKIPNYELPLVAGDTIPIAALLGKKLTILDLWASWCGPCRKENREVLGPMWEEYGARGLQIIGYALEAERNTWLNAMARDQVDRWPQASHLNGDDSPFFQTLNIQTIPANFILDEEGSVLAKNLHGKKLKDFVSNYFSENE